MYEEQKQAIKQGYNSIDIFWEIIKRNYFPGVSKFVLSSFSLSIAVELYVAKHWKDITEEYPPDDSVGYPGEFGYCGIDIDKLFPLASDADPELDSLRNILYDEFDKLCIAWDKKGFFIDLYEKEQRRIWDSPDYQAYLKKIDEEQEATRAYLDEQRKNVGF